MANVAGVSLTTGGNSLFQQAPNISYINTRIRVTMDYDDKIQLNYIGMLNVASTALATLAMADVTAFEKETQFGSRDAVLEAVPIAPRSE
jgi:hypothetical protein